MEITIQRLVVEDSPEKWKMEVCNQISKALKNMNRSFSLTELEALVDQCAGWRLTFSGIDFKIKTV